ncbi:hypothetical protein AI2602V1_2130 [Citrobacter freundii]|uniref:hypothetical protein n=1 Tax=Citrobacter TaxID=544 RepID=UPI001E01B908|nr:hypothetical protein [Citrobacter freundii]CAE6129271.1 hypothetical protein AI2602V1_2130 [Citrobacter freundii]CAH3289760.1 hypothetical protein AI2602V1_2130 [Citrobacter freundii]CAH6044429.1 hypothetical protein AI3058V1_2067 [Citrobacter freundii]
MSSRDKFEQAIKARFGDLIDYRTCKNSDGEYMAWDMQVAWWAWQAAETDMAVQLANAESKCRELAVENVTLNDKMNKLATWPGIEFYSSSWEFCNLDGNDALEFMCDVQTPATDAFLAEVRAQGVEMLAAEYESKIEPYKTHDEFMNAHYLTMQANEARQFAAQLRKGAAL